MGEIAKSIGKAGLLAKLSVRSFTNIDTNPVPKSWTHITKVDPEEEKILPVLYPLYLQHSSAISVGGSRDVNSTNTEETFELLDLVDTPVFHEPSAARHVTEETQEYSEFLAIPEVLNGDSDALVGTLGEGTAYLRNELVPDLIEDKLGWLPQRRTKSFADFLTSWLLEQAVFEAYIIQNVDSAAAREANVTEEDLLTPEEAGQRALAAEKHLESPVIYLEYSGTFGGEEATQTLEAIQQELDWSRLWYGGGIGSREEANQILEAGADTVIVGNVFHDIASEELSLVSNIESDNEVNPTTLTEITDWISSNVDIESTFGCKFLSTIPEVENPEQLAEDYLAKSLSLRLIVSESEEKSRERVGRTSSIESELQRSWTPSSSADSIPSDLLEVLGRNKDSISDAEYSSLLAHVGL